MKCFSLDHKAYTILLFTGEIIFNIDTLSKKYVGYFVSSSSKDERCYLDMNYQQKFLKLFTSIVI